MQRTRIALLAASRHGGCRGAVCDHVVVVVSPARADDFELAMVIKETTNPYYNATLKGAQIAAGEIGGSAKNYGPTQSSGQAQVELINNLADRHVAAIAVAPSDPDAVVPAMKRAQKLGAKVLTFDADSGKEGRPFFVNQATSDSIGRYGAILLVKAMGGNPKGKIAIVSAQPTAANQNLWIESFKDEMKKYPDVQIVDTVYGYDNEQKAFDATVALTTKYPDLAGIFAPTCPGLPAVGRAPSNRSTRATARSRCRATACRASPRSTCSMARSRDSISGIRSSSAT